jgi:hypothetical protein
MGVFAGKTRGRNESERGQMGVSRIEATNGWTIEPPLDKL